MKHVRETTLVKPKLKTKMVKAVKAVKVKKNKSKKKKPNGIEIVPKEETEAIPASRTSDEPIPKKVK